jgi:hypothetical protein
MRRLSVLICTALLTVACSEPPQKEMNRAQGAIDAARAAGAERYAAESLAAANAALQQSHDAVALRDYRLALSLAVDASERAQSAAKEAADGKARARGDGERAVAGTAEALQELRARITAAEAARIPAREIEAARKTASDVELSLQKVRALLSVGDYLAASDALRVRTEAIREQIRRLDAAAAARAVKAPRRRR